MFPMFLDPRIFGQLLGTARRLAGLSREEVARQLLQEAAINITARIIGNYERAQYAPPADVLFGLLIVLKPPGGLAFFRPAMSETYFATVMKAIEGAYQDNDGEANGNNAS